MRCRNAKHPILLLRAAQTSSVKPSADAAAITTAKKRQLQSLYRYTFSNAVVQNDLPTARAIVGESESEGEAVVVVGNSIEFDENSTALVISGPNAGGKTVVLKVSL